MRITPTTLVTGQDGSYLADFLVTQGYRVVGMVRRCSIEKFARFELLRGEIGVCKADLLDQLSIINLLRMVRTAEVDLLQGDASKARPILG